MEIKVSYLQYTEETFTEEVLNLRDGLVVRASDDSTLQWYDIRGLHDEQLIKVIADRYGMHPLAVENAVDIYQRPLYQEFDKGAFISLKHLALDEAGVVQSQLVSIYFGHGYVLTFQEHEDDIFVSLRNRIRQSSGRIRKRQSDYLAYALVDVIVDDYFTVLDRLEQRVETLEDQLATDGQRLDKRQFFSIKKELLKVRKSVVPLREAVGLLYRTESPLIQDSTRSFVRDLYDHTIQITDNVDSIRDVLSGLQDLHIAVVSLEMNKVMQFLTIVTAIFVPLSFLTGLYGMNFVHIPELQHPQGYFILWGAMIILVIGILLWLRKRGWL